MATAINMLKNINILPIAKTVGNIFVGGFALIGGWTVYVTGPVIYTRLGDEKKIDENTTTYSRTIFGKKRVLTITEGDNQDYFWKYNSNLENEKSRKELP